MISKRICPLYFSATKTTEKVVTTIAQRLSANMNGAPICGTDFTPPSARKETIAFTKEDFVVVGLPVYAGRVPNILLNFLKSVKGNGAFAAAVVLYGNRNYDDALIELRDILEADGFKVIAGSAFIGEHAFSKTLAQGRPDAKDLALASDFADRIFNRITSEDTLQTVSVKGNTPYRNYYKPKDTEGNPVDIRKVTPKTSNSCNKCMTCVQLCPMGSIDPEDPSKLIGICIKCGACIKGCPQQAKYYDDENYLRHKHELEIQFAVRREPELF